MEFLTAITTGEHLINQTHGSAVGFPGDSVNGENLRWFSFLLTSRAGIRYYRGSLFAWADGKRFIGRQAEANKQRLAYEEVCITRDPGGGDVFQYRL
jgi:hypothetical protein